jgi:hypothetical protein
MSQFSRADHRPVQIPPRTREAGIWTCSIWKSAVRPAARFMGRWTNGPVCVPPAKLGPTPLRRTCYRFLSVPPAERLFRRVARAEHAGASWFTLAPSGFPAVGAAYGNPAPQHARRSRRPHTESLAWDIDHVVDAAEAAGITPVAVIIRTTPAAVGATQVAAAAPPRCRVPISLQRFPVSNYLPA